MHYRPVVDLFVVCLIAALEEALSVRSECYTPDKLGRQRDADSHTSDGLIAQEKLMAEVAIG